MPVLLPDRRDARHDPADAGRLRACPRRRVLLRHDDDARAGQLAGDPSRRRLRADRGRPGRRGQRAPGLRAVSTARPPRDRAMRSAAPATSTTPRSRRRRWSTAATNGSRSIDVDAHHGNGTAAIFYDARRRVLRVGARRPGAGWFPHFVGHARETGRVRGPARRSTCRWHPARVTRSSSGGRRRLADTAQAHGSTALVVSLGVDAAADDPESPLQVTADGICPRRSDPLRGAGSTHRRRPGGRLPPPDAWRPGRAFLARRRVSRRVRRDSEPYDRPHVLLLGWPPGSTCT